MQLTDERIREFCKNVYGVELTDYQVETIKIMSSKDHSHICMPPKMGRSDTRAIAYMMDVIFGERSKG